MRWRPWLWLLVSLMCFLGAVYFWRLGEQWAAEKKAAPASPGRAKPEAAPAHPPLGQLRSAPIPLLSAGNLNAWPETPPVKTNHSGRFKYRLSNSTSTVGQLARSDSAVLLENALFDTTKPTALAIPDRLRAQGDPGSYIVQARGPVDEKLRGL